MHVKEPRDLTEVLAQMLDLIPESETELRARLSQIRDSAFYTPPEEMSGQWRFALDALIQCIGKPKTEWQIQVCELFGPRKQQRHFCEPDSLPWTGYGAAIENCCEDERGFFWVDNGEYGSPVNFCPWCGKKAPRPASEAATYSKDGEYVRRTIKYDKRDAPVTAGEMMALKTLSDEGRLPEGVVTPEMLKHLLDCAHTNEPRPCARCLGYADEREMAAEEASPARRVEH